MTGNAIAQSMDVADQAFSRTAGADLIHGNRVRLLRDGAENYPAWIRAIRNARRCIHLETYIFRGDEIGRQFAALLCEKALEGVHVCVLVDWFGTWGRLSRSMGRRFAASGVEVRRFNPPSLYSTFGVLSRDHRKLLTVDGRLGFAAGLCIGQDWVGYPARHLAPWRDTGVEIEGPAVIQMDRAFAVSWAASGAALVPEAPSAPWREAGDASIRVVASVPAAGAIYRLDQLITTLARRTMWLADAYFAGTTAYVHALRSAAEAGVDVRLLIPGASDVPVFRAISRAGLRPLLECGIRIFEWNGPMMHAKTAVVDGEWSRVGSTNLNLSSWLGNWELDVVIENKGFAGEMEAMYLDDLAHSTEIVLEAGRRRPIGPRHIGGGDWRQQRTKTRGRSAAAGAMRFSRSVGAAISGRRELGSAEMVMTVWGAGLVTAITGIFFFWPRLFAIPLGVLSAWVALSLFLQAFKLWRRR